MSIVLYLLIRLYKPIFNFKGFYTDYNKKISITLGKSLKMQSSCIPIIHDLLYSLIYISVHNLNK